MVGLGGVCLWVFSKVSTLNHEYILLRGFFPNNIPIIRIPKSLTAQRLGEMTPSGGSGGAGVSGDSGTA